VLLSWGSFSDQISPQPAVLHTVVCAEIASLNCAVWEASRSAVADKPVLLLSVALSFSVAPMLMGHACLEHSAQLLPLTRFHNLTSQGRVRTKTVKKSARLVVERFYQKLSQNDFDTNKRVSVLCQPAN